jgi:hypothetical protein
MGSRVDAMLPIGSIMLGKLWVSVPERPVGKCAANIEHPNTAASGQIPASSAGSRL